MRFSICSRLVISKIRDFFEGAGVALLLVVTHIWPLLSPYHVAIYHDPVSAPSFAGGLAIDLALAAVLFAVLFFALDRIGPHKAQFVWAIVVAFGLTRSIAFAVFLLNFYQVNLPLSRTVEASIFAAILIGAIAAARYLPRLFQGSVKTARFGLAIFGCCILWMLPALVYTAVVGRNSGTMGRGLQPTGLCAEGNRLARPGDLDPDG